MDRIWTETLARLDALEKRCERIECYLKHIVLPDSDLEVGKYLPDPAEPQGSEPKEEPESLPESEKDTVDLPAEQPAADQAESPNEPAPGSIKPFTKP